MKKIICLWSRPRNVSTALMYSFRSRKDTNVFDEALYGHYLIKSKLQHPGRHETLKSLECDGEKVIRDIILKIRRYTTLPRASLGKNKKVRLMTTIDKSNLLLSFDV